MADVNIELTDVPYPMPSVRLSITELASKPNGEITAALQRTFLYMCDVMRKADVPTANLVAGLLGAGMQDYLEKAMLQEIETERAAHPNFPASLTVLTRFMHAFGGMLEKLEVPPGLVGVGMMNAGLVLARKELEPEKLANEVEQMLEIARGR